MSSSVGQMMERQNPTASTSKVAGGSLLTPGLLLSSKLGHASLLNCSEGAMIQNPLSFRKDSCLDYSAPMI